MTKYMTTTEKVFFGAILAAILFVLIAVFSPVGGAFGATGEKPPSPPGQGECEHGNSQKPCKDDPQPEHGKDCEEHGPKEGGVNEDHCKGETPPPPGCTQNCTPPPPGCTQNCTTPEPPKEPPVCNDCPIPTVPETPVTPPTTAPAPESSGTPPAVSKPTLEEELEEQAQENGAPSGHQTTNGAAPTGASATSLPYTGLPLGAWVALGLGLVGSGLYLRRRAA